MQVERPGSQAARALPGDDDRAKPRTAITTSLITTCLSRSAAACRRSWEPAGHFPMLAPVIDEKKPLGLGSASPRRKALLETLGMPLLVIAVDADERRRDGEWPDAYLERVTSDKLARVAADDRALG